MIEFRQKSFGKISKAIKNNPISAASLGVSATSLGIAGANYRVNTKRQQEAKDIANKQLEMMGKQMEVIKANTRALNDSINSQREVSTAFREGINHNTPTPLIKPVPRKKKKSIFNRIFSETQPTDSRRKLFSIKSSVIAGATLGGSLATLGTASPGLSNLTGKGMGKVGFSKYDNLKKVEQKMAMVAAGTLVGAALGALVGCISELDKKTSRGDVNKRLLRDVVSNLKKDNLREDYDYTLNPKFADRLNTKVCIALSRYSEDLRILINTKADPKLKQVTDRIVKNIPNAGVENTSANNKFNEITISTISDSSANATLVSGISEQFIHSGFPVYLVEVG